MPHARFSLFTIAAALWVTGAAAAVPGQHFHSLEADQHDTREDTPSLRA
jgi:hypothetical protein